MKRSFLSWGLVFCCALQVVAQKLASGVYASTKSPVYIQMPKQRNVYGGTVFNVKYNGSKISNTIKNAFEYACKIVEEAMPTTYPLYITVEFSDFMPDDCLAMVDSYNGIVLGRYGNYSVDKVFCKRYAQIWGYEEFSNDSVGLKFFRDTPDATIYFANKRSIFDYNINSDNLSPDKYDFVTVAIQALLKAVGFTCQAYVVDNQLVMSEPANQFTRTLLLKDDPYFNYTKATSGDAYITGFLSKKKWLLVSDASYKPGVSLCYFVGSDDKETAIMQYGISKGTYIRYVGSAFKDFFSYCGWDRQIATGSGGGSYITEGKTNEVLAYQPVTKSTMVSNNILTSSKSASSKAENETFYSYIESREEVKGAGDFVLLKDGSWKAYRNRSDLYENELYARTSDGYLRLKTVYQEAGVGGNYYNWKVDYYLAQYIPQKPIASLNGYEEISDAMMVSNSDRRMLVKMSDEDEFVDVEVGFKNIEGTTYVMVEQTDADYPVPYTYFVDDPGAGKFMTYMNKRYPSTFKLTYVNANGQTIGDSFTIDLTAEQTTDMSIMDFHSTVSGNDIIYSIDGAETVNLNYTIADVFSGNIVKKGVIREKNGSLNTLELEEGFYILSVFNGGYKISELKWHKDK